jgi:hypothetical protein
MKTGILWENQMERDHLGRPGCRWEKSGGGVPWIKGHENLDKWQSVVNMGMDIWVSKTAENLFNR